MTLECTEDTGSFRSGCTAAVERSPLSGVDATSWTTKPLANVRKIVTITMVKNEIDIVEPFIRYHSELGYRMLILDNGSTDGTPEVIRRMVTTGFAVDLIFDDTPAFTQAEIMTDLLYAAIDRYDPDLVIPLDTDEFVRTHSGRSVADVMIEVSLARVTQVEWLTYVPTDSDDETELNPILRMRNRRAVQHNYDAKVIIPALLALQRRLRLSQGSHQVFADGEGATLEFEPHPDLCLAHYPVRSADQVRSKYLVGWLANLARPTQVLFDWYPFFNRMKDERPLTGPELTQMALYYNVADKQQPISLVEDPLKVDFIADFELQYTRVSVPSYIQNVINYAELLARKYSQLAYQSVSSTSRASVYDDQIVMQIIHDFVLIDGWLSPAEAVALYLTARATPRQDVVLCEIGSWLGKSSYVLARALDGKPNSVLYCIDPFDGSGDTLSQPTYNNARAHSSKSLLDQFTENMQRFGTLDRICIIPSSSQQANETFSRQIDLLFIDGNHDYEAVRDDFLLWSPRVRPGGWIVFHDVGSSHLSGPKRVVEEFIVHQDAWRDQQLIEEIYIARKHLVCGNANV